MAEATFSLDLHVLGTPPAFILSQDQTLQLNPVCSGPAKTLGSLFRNDSQDPDEPDPTGSGKPDPLQRDLRRNAGPRRHLTVDVSI
jgi:hypothetical protein